MNASQDHIATPPDSIFARKSELAKILGVSPRTINNWASTGVIPVIKIKRVLLFDLSRVKEALQRYER